MHLFYAIFIGLVLLSCRHESNKATKENYNSSANKTAKTLNTNPSLDILNFEEFQKFLNTSDNKIHVVNFWATWCAPCVKELPYFEKINNIYKDDVEVVLVSLDFPHLYNSKLKPFIIKNKLNSKVIALNAPNENMWINKIDTSWSGSIPATIIFNSKKRKFFEKSFTFEALEHEIKQFK